MRMPVSRGLVKASAHDSRCTTASHVCIFCTMARPTSPPSASTEQALNALDTRDLTLPQRLWSWLAKQASDRQCSVDEIVAVLIDAHRHPEQADTAAVPSDASGTPPGSSPEAMASPAEEQSSHNETSTQTKRTTTADRLREMSDRLHKLRNTAGKGATDSDTETEVDQEALRKTQESLRASRGDGASPSASSPKNSSSEQKQDPDTGRLIDQAMQALHESDASRSEADRGSENNSGGSSMFDVVRETE